MKALVLGGGGSRGAFQAGALKALDELGQLEKVNCVYGTSVGAFNSTFSCIGVQNLVERWLDVESPTDVLKKNFISWLWSGGFNNLKPIRKFLEREILGYPRTFQKQTKVITVEQNTGTVVIGNSSIHSKEDMIRFIIGSMSIPVMMEPFDGMIDGGVREMSAISRAIKDGAKEIIAIANTPTNETVGPVKKFFLPIITNGFRAVEILEQEVFYNDYDLSSHVGKPLGITLIEPDRSLGSNMDFSKQTISRLLAKGYNMTKERFKNVK